jgi:DNA-binding MarR family transcriptional regulator
VAARRWRPRVGALTLASSLPKRPVRTSLPRDSADQLTARQQAVLNVIAARHPRPVTSAQLATELQLAAGTLNVTLRSLQRRQLIVAVPTTARRRGGWTLWPWP